MLPFPLVGGSRCCRGARLAGGRRSSTLDGRLLLARLASRWATCATLSVVVCAVLRATHSGATVASTAVAATLALVVLHVSGGTVIPAGTAVTAVERISDRDTATEQEPGDKYATTDDTSEREALAVAQRCSSRRCYRVCVCRSRGRCFRSCVCGLVDCHDVFPFVLARLDCQALLLSSR